MHMRVEDRVWCIIYKTEQAKTQRESEVGIFLVLGGWLCCLIQVIKRLVNFFLPFDYSFLVFF